MRPSLADCRKVLSVLAWSAALGCGGDQGPPPTIRLSIQGQILSTDPTPVPVGGADVALGWWDSTATLARVYADQAGHYQLTHTFASTCQPSDQTLYLIGVKAAGYEPTSTLSFHPGTLVDPPILCTSDPQVINLSLNPLGWVRLITNTTGSGLDPNGYVPAFTGRFDSNFGGTTSIGYPMAVNAEQIIPLLPGPFVLELTEVAENCTVAGDNPRTATVVARETLVAAFDVTCTP
jgi:hypothetical protein